MVDTDFHVRPELMPRFCATYAYDRARQLRLFDDSVETAFARPPAIASGGGGLVSTATDYQRFCRMILNRGTLDGARLLGRKTVDLMLANHLPGDLAAMGTPRFAETSYTHAAARPALAPADPARTARLDLRGPRRLRAGRGRVGAAHSSLGASEAAGF